MRRWLVQLLVLPFLFSIGAPASAATTTVTIAWDANPEPDLAGYKLYQGTTAGGPYTLVQTVGLVFTTVVPGVADGRTCWVLTAVDSATPPNESGYSNEVCFLFDSTPPSVPSNLAATSLVRVP